MPTDRAPLSSIFAFLGALAIAAFTLGAIQATPSLHWSMWLVVTWSFVLAIALVVWSVRNVFNIHLIGSPTLGMVAGASASSLAAVALAFSYSAMKDQDETQLKQRQLLEAQLQSMQRIERRLSEIQALPSSSATASASPATTPGK